MIRMAKSLEQLSIGRNNNLNLIRFCAATLVIVTHAFGVTGNAHEPLSSMAGVSLGSVAVDVFFVVSGFLISKSWINKSNFTDFFFARFLRIYPALWVSIIFCVLLIGINTTTLKASEYLLHRETLRYIYTNATLLYDGTYTSLPGVFHNLLNHKVNLPLWTLPHELKMYILLAGFAIFGILYRPWFLLTLISVAGIFFAASFCNLLPGSAGDEPTYGEDVTRFIMFFFSGALLYAARKKIVLSVKILATLIFVVIILFILIEELQVRRIILAIFLPYFVAYLAFVPSGWIRRFNDIGDYSYGLYIYGFPIQQTIQYTTNSSSTLFNFGISFILTLIIAVLSWHLLESKVLRTNKPRWLVRIDEFICANLRFLNSRYTAN